MGAAVGKYAEAEKQGRLASDKFLRAAQQISDKRTIDALVLLAENYEYRSKVARARNPTPSKDEAIEEHDAETAEVTRQAGEDRTGGDGERAANAEIATAARPSETTAGVDPNASAATEAQLKLAAVEMEELWRRLHEIGLSTGGSSDMVRSALWRRCCG